MYMYCTVYIYIYIYIYAYNESRSSQPRSPQPWSPQHRHLNPLISTLTHIVKPILLKTAFSLSSIFNIYFGSKKSRLFFKISVISTIF